MREKHLTGRVAVLSALACTLVVSLMLYGTGCDILCDCLFPPATCTTNADCPEGEVCVDGECVAEPVGCTTDADCSEGEVCVDGECAAAPVGCTTDAECDDGLFCTGTETCVNGECQEGTDPCTAGQVCDEETDTCAAEASTYATNALIDDFDRVHGLHQAAGFGCDPCHHTEPVDAGFNSCTMCHSDDPNELNSFKQVAHDEDEDDNGCRSCHNQTTEDGLWDCTVCHTALLDL